MKHRLLAAMAAFVCASSVSQAQTTEEWYAQLCSHGEQNISCDAMKKEIDIQQTVSRENRAMIEGADEDTRKLAETWGFLAYLVNTTWVRGGNATTTPSKELAHDFAEIDSFAWVEDKTAIRYLSGMNMADSTEIVFRPGSEKGTLIGELLWIPSMGKKINLVYRYGPDGVLASDWYRTKPINLRRAIKFTADHYSSQLAMGMKKDQPEFGAWDHTFRRTSGQEMMNIINNRERAYDIILAQVQQQADEMVRQREREKRERWTRFWSGAAAVMNAASVVASETHAAMQESGYSTSSIGSAVPSPGKASYPTQPPVDLGEACQGFTQENYRTKAVNAPGDDAHLYAACGQAFELYHMYLNAIRQGYSESDSMRTWNAHAGAAENAKEYFRTRRAN